MGDSEDDARYPKKLYSLNRQNHPMYSRPIPKRHAYYREEEDDEEDEEDEELSEYPEQNDEEDDVPQGYSRKFGSSEGLERFSKRQKQSQPVSGYEFAGPSDAKLAYDWSEHEAFVLLEVWGDRFLQLGRRSLRNEDWLFPWEKNQILFLIVLILQINLYLRQRCPQNLGPVYICYAK